MLCEEIKRDMFSQDVGPIVKVDLWIKTLLCLAEHKLAYIAAVSKIQHETWTFHSHLHNILCHTMAI